MSDKKPQPHAGIEQISPYVPGKSGSSFGGKIFKLSSNETPLGPSPTVRDAIVESAQNLEIYPDGSLSELRKAIGDVHNLDPERIICGAGSDELLHLLGQAYLTPDDEAIYSKYGFLMYRIAILAAGATPVIAPENGYTVDPDAIRDCITNKTKIIYIANPNNPTGTYLSRNELEALIKDIPSHILFVIDAAYAEYVKEQDYHDGIELVDTYPNVIMTRTFSKIYGLAGLRLGWAYGQTPVIETLNRIRGPFNVNSVALKAGVAAIKDQTFMEKAATHNLEWLDIMREAFDKLGLRVTPSVGNFLLIHFSDEDGKTAKDADAFLSAQGLVLRNVASYGLPNALRLTIGEKEANERVLAALKDFFNA